MLSQKNKIICFLLPYPLGVAPGQRFRFEQYLELLKQEGFTIKIFPFLSETSNRIIYRKGYFLRKIVGVLSGYFRRLIFLPEFINSDYIFIFREAAPLGPPVIEWLISHVFKKKIVYDFDDAIWLPNTSQENKIISKLKMHTKVKSICKWSYKVSCGNSYLADFARNFNSSVIINPTTINTVNLHNPNLFEQARSTESFVIGWTGSHSTLHYILPVLPSIEMLWRKYPSIQLLIIADKNPFFEKAFVKFIKWNKQTEIADLMKFDIGIMPLTDDPWAKGKCGFKALQYMSLEKPALVSPVGVNTEIVIHGLNGYHCSSLQDWINQFEFLMLNPDKRKHLGINGRRTVIDHYSVLSNSSNFLSLFE